MKAKSQPAFTSKTTGGITGEVITVDGLSRFPKRVIILEVGKRKEYLLRRSRSGGYLLNK